MLARLLHVIFYLSVPLKPYLYVSLKGIKEPYSKSSLLPCIIFLFFFGLQSNIGIYESDQKIVTSRTSSPSISYWKLDWPYLFLVTRTGTTSC